MYSNFSSFKIALHVFIDLCKNSRRDDLALRYCTLEIVFSAMRNYYTIPTTLIYTVIPYTYYIIIYVIWGVSFCKDFLQNM